MHQKIIRHRAEALAGPLRRAQSIGEAADSSLKPPVFKLAFQFGGSSLEINSKELFLGGDPPHSLQLLAWTATPTGRLKIYKTKSESFN